MKRILLILLCTFPFLASSQEQFNSCEIDSAKGLNLHIIAWYPSENNRTTNDEIMSYMLLNYIEEDERQIDYNCSGRYLINYSDSAQRYYAYYPSWDEKSDSSYEKFIAYLDLSQVKTLEISVANDNEFAKKKMDLSLIDPIRNLKELTKLESISISDGPNYPMPVEVNLAKWSCYESLVKGNTLTGFSLNQAYVSDYAVHEDLKAIHSLRKLELPYYTNNGLAELVQLESIKMPDASAFFAHSLAKVPNLKSIYNSGYNVNSYACDVFFANLISIEDTSNQLHNFHLKLTEVVAKNCAVDGFYFLCYNEKTHFTFVSDESDSAGCIASGEIRNGVPTGVWNFHVNRYGHFTKTGYPYDYTFKDPVYFPENGNWAYYYPNCVLAIEGRFQNGLKEGEWKFYDLNGKLSDTKHFRADEAEGLFITNSIPPYHNWFTADRLTYYLNNREYYFMREGALHYKGENGFESSDESETVYNKLPEMKEILKSDN